MDRISNKDLIVFVWKSFCKYQHCLLFFRYGIVIITYWSLKQKGFNIQLNAESILCITKFSILNLVLSVIGECGMIHLQMLEMAKILMTTWFQKLSLNPVHFSDGYDKSYGIKVCRFIKYFKLSFHLSHKKNTSPEHVWISGTFDYIPRISGLFHQKTTWQKAFSEALYKSRNEMNSNSDKVFNNNSRFVSSRAVRRPSQSKKLVFIRLFTPLPTQNRLKKMYFS